MTINESKCTAQAQLAEAITLIREAKNELRTGPSYGWEDRLAGKLGTFLAQAEQQEAQSPMAKIAEGLRQKAAGEWANHPSNPANQEARNAEVARESLRPENQRIEPVEPLSVPHPLEAHGAQAGEFQREDRYIVIKRKDLEKAPFGDRVDFQEALDVLVEHLPERKFLVIESDWPEYEPTWAAIQARMTGQGAQAGDERAAFEAWFTEKSKTLPLLRGESVLRYHKGEGQYVSDWALFGHMAWEARAALATQSAAGEPIGKVELFGINMTYVEWRERKMPPLGTELYTAPPAAAHGDEAACDKAVLERLRDLYESAYGAGQNNPNGYSSLHDREWEVQDAFRAMRAQGDES